MIQQLSHCARGFYFSFIVLGIIISLISLLVCKEDVVRKGFKNKFEYWVCNLFFIFLVLFSVWLVIFIIYSITDVVKNLYILYFT